MSRSAMRAACAVVVATGFACGGTQAGDAPASDAAAVITPEIQAHLDAALEAAGSDHKPLYDRVCAQAATLSRRADYAAPGGVRSAGGGGASQGPPPRSEWYAEPVQVFDNLYFVGQTEYTAWAITTSEGIIIIDPIYDYSVEAEVVEGLTKLGLDPSTIRYVLISHAHGDHVGGARLLQERYGAHVIMGEDDWALLERSGGSWPKPVRDMVAEDGQQLRLGSTTLTLYVTPGHTPGTISTIIPVTDGGIPHVAALWGGTAYNFLGSDDQAMWFQRYIESSQRFAQLARAAGADVLISNHSRFDGSKTKLPALANRRPGDPHPFVVGGESIQRYLTVGEECAKAGLLGVS
jgi:metallo-beta-lactamase class B